MRETAVRVRETLQSALLSLEDFAERGRPIVEHDLRELLAPFGRSAYVIQYRIAGEAVLIARIFHARERR